MNETGSCNTNKNLSLALENHESTQMVDGPDLPQTRVQIIQLIHASGNRALFSSWKEKFLDTIAHL